ncbi:MAG TPA: protein kinase [Gemmatimonadaceae bacterium]|nr:protein kinase [Gemmatimonadaceae bacterium]
MNARLAAALAGKYELVRELGEGAMGTVWLARDLRHDRAVAIKLLHADFAGAIGVDRFLREIRLTAGLQHPNIVPVFDSGSVPGGEGTELPWFAMPYLEGESLRGRLKREGQLPIAEAVRIATGIADALQHAHRQGIVHRDIKPENVLLVDGHVYVVDFGIAKALMELGGDRLTSAGLAIGTPAYMSPEQASAGPVDARSDQYSLATVLYEMLAGEPPFTGATASATIARRFAEAPRPIRPVRPAVPPGMERAILRGLERVPADRFEDVGAFTEALAADASNAVERLPLNRRRALHILAGALVVAVVGVSSWLFLRPGSTGPRDPALVALYTRGVRGYHRRTPAGAAEAIASFNDVITRDSTYTEAWTGLAKTYVRAYERAFAIAGIPRDSMLKRAVTAAEGAMAADPGSADVWLTQALVNRQIDPTERAATFRAVRRALELDSSNVESWHVLAISLAETGHMDEAVRAWRRSVALKPSYEQGVAFLALGHYWQRRFDSAAVWADSVVALDPTYVLGRTTAGQIAVARGDFARAIAAFDATRRLTTGVEIVDGMAGVALAEASAGRVSRAREILQRAESLAAGYAPVPHHTAIYLAHAYAALAEREKAVRWIEQHEPRADLHFQLHLRCDAPFDVIRGDPRFQALLTAVAPSQGSGC